MLVKTCVRVAYLSHHVNQIDIFQEIYNLLVFIDRTDLTYYVETNKVTYSMSQLRPFRKFDILFTQIS